MAASTDLVLMDDTSSKAEARRKAWDNIQAAVSPIIGSLTATIADRIKRRDPIERRWMEDLRQYYGNYEETVTAIFREDKERSSVFINITRPKTNAWRARLGDMLFPNDERNWGIDPTPVPQLTRESQQAAQQAEELEAQAAQTVDDHNASVDQGGQGAPGQQLVTAQQAANQALTFRKIEKDRQAVIEEARRRCQAMQREIDDQLTESHYPAKCRDVIDDMCKVGVGIMKGPIVNDRARHSWQVDGQTGAAKMVADNGCTPTFRRVDFWHYFPDPDADTVDEGQGEFERYMPNRKMLKKMAKDIGFDPRTVREMLVEGPRAGNNTSAQDYTRLAEIRNLENDSKDTSNFDILKDRWVVWEYHGPLEVDDIAAMIRAMGRFEDADRFEKTADPLDEIVVRVFFCNDRLLKIEEDYLLDSGASIYSVATFEKSENSILGGIGVPRLMRNEQAMLNSAVRMMMDNAALATGPQIVVDKAAIEPENGSWKLTPRKVWQTVKTAALGEKDGQRPFQTYDIPMNQALLANIIQLAVKFVDESVSMPLIAQGEQGAHVTQTAQGMSILFNSANVVFRRVVKNWDDDITAGLITRIYDFNMQFSTKPEIKGDMKVEARGTSVLLVREIQTEQLMQIINQWVLNPVLGVGLRAYNCMRLVLQAMNINPDDVLVSEEEFMQKLKTMSENRSQGDGGAAVEQIKAKTAVDIARIDAASREKVAGTTLDVARINQATEFARLAQNKDISIAQIEAMFNGKKLDAHVKLTQSQLTTTSSERKMAAEIGAERQNAADDRAAGLEPTGSGGYVSFGAQKAPAAPKPLPTVMA